MTQEDIKVTNFTQVYVQKRHQILLDDVATGLLEETWDWTIPLE